MARTILRLTSSLGLTLCLSLVFMPLGCGGSSHGSVEPVRAANKDPPVPQGTFSAMMACVTEAKGRLTDTVYAMQFDVEVTETGEADRVKFRDSSPSESALEACIGHALEGMTVPVSVLRLILKEKAVSLESRGLMGQVWEEAVEVGASLGPIFLAVATVTVIVVVGVHFTAEAIEAARRKSKNQCAGMFAECKDRGYPCNKMVEAGNTMCEICLRNCIRNDPYKFSQCTQCGFK